MNFPYVLYTVDVLLVLGLIAVAFQGMKSGFYRETANIVTLLFILYAFCFGYPALIEWFVYKWEALSPRLYSWIAFSVLLLLSVGVYLSVRYLFDRFLKVWIGGFSGKVSGAVMGVCRGVVLFVCLVAIASRLPSDRLCSVVKGQSFAGRFVCETLHPLVPSVPSGRKN